MRLTRMAARRSMIAVVVIGLVMGGIVGGLRIEWRHDDFQSRARFHTELEALCQERARN
jgi:hypothetical protein